MASYLIDKLEALKENENKLKEQKRVLMEEIELDIEKKRRLELDGTITKLRTQVSEISKNIEGKIMPDNRNLVLRFGKHNWTQEEKQEIQQQQNNRNPEMTTLEKFKDNLSKVSKDHRERLKVQGTQYDNGRKMVVEIPHQIKIYDDIIPIFTTMIGIMKKQEFEIDNLKQKMGNILKDI